MLDEAALLAAFRVNHHPEAEPSSVELAKLRAAITAYLKNLPAEPVAWRWKAPAGDKDWFVWNYSTVIDDINDPRCEPLYSHPPRITDEAVERAAKAIQATKINGQRVRFSDAYAAMMARAALEAASRERREG